MHAILIFIFYNQRKPFLIFHFSFNPTINLTSLQDGCALERESERTCVEIEYVSLNAQMHLKICWKYDDVLCIISWLYTNTKPTLTI